MKKQATLSRSTLIVALVTALLLMVPFVAMQFTSEVDWSLSDFLIMGTLIFGTGMSYVLLTRSTPNIVYRIAIAWTLGTTFFMIWANLAVGLIASGPNAGNLMYVGVVLVVVMGTIRSRFKAAGMELSMYAAAIAIAVLTAIAFLTGMHRYPGSSVTEVLAVNGFFAALYVIAASLFRLAARQAPSRQVQ